MHREMSIAGYCMSEHEWNSMDDNLRLQYLRVFIETSPPRSDEWAYATYELMIEKAA